MQATEAGTASADEVLFSPDLWLQQLWPWLDRDSKAALCGLSIAMRGQLWPRVTHLTLLAVSEPADLAPLATTALARLASLTVREAPRAVADEAHPWDMLATTLSSGVAATLQVIDLSDCIDLRSIELVRSCVQLSETLEELWMAGDVQVRSLAPLAACTKLCKLDLRGCLPALNAQVQDLQLTCTQLAAPPSVELQGLVHELQHRIPPDMQQIAARALRIMLRKGGLEVQNASAAAGAIPALVRLLGLESSAGLQEAAAFALGSLASKHAEN
ncbi:hypothetical protein FOA52_013169 [Chlamydomonas sp. UWO 241]|nr:hypothetical protein FOA52_013169 [Chlamydomonas sp. UWO 241]